MATAATVALMSTALLGLRREHLSLTGAKKGDAFQYSIAEPIGGKGLGETVIVGVAAAIANAVFNATGRRITGLPITCETLL